ncbi:TPA: YadA-like family protein [Vibrio cholerae]
MKNTIALLLLVSSSAFAVTQTEHDELYDHVIEVQTHLESQTSDLYNRKVENSVFEEEMARQDHNLNQVKEHTQNLQQWAEVDSTDIRDRINTEEQARIDSTERLESRIVKTETGMNNKASHEYVDAKLESKVDRISQADRDNRQNKKIYNNSESIKTERKERIESQNKMIIEQRNYTDNKFSTLNQTVEKNKKQASAGIAGVAAMANIPQVSQGSTFSVGLGVGQFSTEQAVAFGFSARISDNIVTKVSTSSTSEGTWVLGAGAAVEW